MSTVLTAQTPAQRRFTSGVRASFGKTGPQNITIRTLLVQDQLYYNIPQRQRDEVWPRWKQQLYIDTLLRGPDFMPLTPIVFNQEWVDEADGNRRLIYTVEDGRQRLSTIYAFFNGKLKTFTKSEYNKHILIDLDELPYDKRFNQLDEEMKQLFLAFALPSLVAEEVDPAVAGERFRRRNSGMQISKGEDLRSYGPNAATELIEEIVAHNLWYGVARENRRRERHYRFEVGLYVAYMQIHGIPVEFSKNRVKALAAGREDAAVTESMRQAVLQRLDRLNHVFRGINVTAKTDAIAVWQAGVYLARAGCDFEASEEGCLKDWFDDVKVQRPRRGAIGNLSTYSQLSHKNLQIEFWQEFKQKLLDQPGLVFPNHDLWEKECRTIELLPPARGKTFDESGVVLVDSDAITL